MFTTPPMIAVKPEDRRELNKMGLKSETFCGHVLARLANNPGIVPPNLGGDQNERVRADLSFGETPSGGALFATSSIAWCGSLAHNNYDNNVSKICWNVLERFVDPKPFSSAD